jgi:hypothetical protein
MYHLFFHTYSSNSTTILLWHALKLLNRFKYESEVKIEEKQGIGGMFPSL